jgi:hypothetical protein
MVVYDKHPGLGLKPSKSAPFRPPAISEYAVALATLDGDSGMRRGSHIFVGDEAPLVRDQ